MPPIQPSPRFDKARTLTLLTERARLGHPAHTWGRSLLSVCTALSRLCVQVKDLGSGNFGVARLEREVATGELVAVKYLPRGPSVRTKAPRPHQLLLRTIGGLTRCAATRTGGRERGTRAGVPPYAAPRQRRLVQGGACVSVLVGAQTGQWSPFVALH
jgi:hypothetical protein